MVHTLTKSISSQEMLIKKIHLVSSLFLIFYGMTTPMTSCPYRKLLRLRARPRDLREFLLGPLAPQLRISAVPKSRFTAKRTTNEQQPINQPCHLIHPKRQLNHPQTQIRQPTALPYPPSDVRCVTQTQDSERLFDSPESSQESITTEPCALEDRPQKNSDLLQGLLIRFRETALPRFLQPHRSSPMAE